MSTSTTTDIQPPSLSRLPNVEDIYPVSPMQQGMLFHTLYQPESEMYHIQFGCHIERGLNVQAFRRAWEEVVRRHSVLRTAFLWEGLKAPVQVVRRKVQLPWHEEDWRHLSAENRKTQWKDSILRDRRSPLALNQAPLMRFALLRTSEDGYYFRWSYHHAVLDGWCRQIIIREVFTFYEAYREDRFVKLEKPRPYRDYISWLQKQDESRAEAFWRIELSGFTKPTRLGIEQQRTELTDGEPEYCKTMLQLDRGLTEEAESLARRHLVTQNTVVQAAWAVLLSRYSGVPDVTFGATVAGRSADVSGIESMVGLFINTLPVRVRLPEGETVVACLKRLQARQAEAREYEHSPLLKIQEWSQVQRGTPLFEHIAVFENFPVDAGTRDRLSSTLQIGELENFDVNNFALTLVANPGSELSFICSFSRRQFDRESIDRILRQLAVVLRKMVETPNGRVGDLSLLTNQELHQVLVEWNRTDVEYPQKLVHDLFEAQAEKTPGALAVEHEGRRLSYAELNRRANQVGHYLRGLGAGPETTIGICIDRVPEMLVGLLGILKAGAAYVPLDPAYPLDRIGYMIGDAQVPVLLTQKHLRQRLPTAWIQVVDIEEEWNAITAMPDCHPESGVTADNLAYVIYTSGSTGRPKGVAVTHRGMSNYVQWAGGAYRMPEGSASPVHSSLSFDLTVTSLFPPLLSGGHVVLLKQSQEMDSLVRLLESATNVNLVKLTPSHLQALNVLMNQGRVPGAAPVLVIGGEALKYADLEFWRSNGRPTRFVNEYGPTETVVGSVIHEVGRNERGRGDVPIGKPIANTQVYVLDERLEPAPPGVAGELYIGGAGVTRGYLNRADLTAECFLPDSWSGANGGRLYRTGDKARWESGGVLTYLGRFDEQIKIHGHRIELGEIESVLRDGQSVHQAVVTVREERPGEKRLIAYVTRKANSGPLNMKALRTFTESHVPAYMVPQTIVELEELPLTANGKLDREALPAPEEVRNEGACVGPGSPEEEILCGIVGAVLNVERIGVRDNFFEIGGHSLLAAQVISQIRSLLEVELPLRVLFDAPTVAQMAEIVRLARRADQKPVPLLEPVPRPVDLPLSYAQQRLWFLDQLEPGTGTYNLPFGLRIVGELDRPALERSLNEMIRRHEVLRTSFPVKDGKPVQEIDAEAHVRFDDVDLQARADGQREADLTRRVSEEINRPFDLSRGPLLRARLFRLGEQDHVLLVTTHHIAGDMWSTGVIIREFSQFYQAFVSGEELKLPALSIQYADFSLWQRGQLQTEAIAAQIEYWRRQLKDLSVLGFPLDRPRPAVVDHRGANAKFELPAELANNLRELCRREGVTLFMVLLAAFQVLLSKYTTQTDIAVGTVSANRNRKEIEGLIGFFANTLVLRTTLMAGMSFRDLLAKVRQTTLEAYEHQDAPFEKVVEELQPERDLSLTPLFQVMLILQNAMSGDLRIPGLRLQEFSFPTTAARFDLTLQVNPWSGGVRGTFLYASALFDHQRIERMSGHLQLVLQCMTDLPESQLAAVSLLTDAERVQILRDWNATGAEYLRKVVHELFEAQVAKSPTAPAAEHENQVLSYHELNCRVNQLARHLRRLGVGPEVRVGICLERGLEMLVALLGTLKAGGAYVPLSPEDPGERLAHVIGDAGLSVVLTEHRLIRALSAYTGQIVELDRAGEEISRHGTENVNTGLHEENLAYVLYTSGSTGKPKGVAVRHGAVSNFLAAMRTRPGIGPEDKLLAVTPISFDIAGLDLYLPLIAGACLRIVSRAVSASGELLAQELGKGITVMQATPVTWQMLADAGSGEIARVRVLCGGEALPESLAGRLSGKSGVIWNMYGPTETTIWSVVEELEITKDRVNIGRPIANTQVYVLDPEMNLVPAGISGELYIGGLGLARGYWNRPDLTAEKFLPDSFDRDGGGRLYRTGDVVRWRFDGKLEFRGRSDYQVKLRGHRIELGEVETALNRCEDVAQSVVIMREDRPGDKRLIGYVVRKAGRPALNVSELRAGLAQRLPDYMIPSVVLELPELPLTPNGKADRKALPAPDWKDGGKAYAEPQSEEQEILCGIFADLLGLPQVGVDAGFFELGGHSLLATQLLARIHSVFGVEMPVRTLFEASTVRTLSGRLRESRRSPAAIASQPLLPTGRDGDMVLSYAQQRLWFLYELEPGSAAYNVPFALRLTGEPDRAALQRSIDSMIKRHEILRTCFPSLNGKPVQKIVSGMALKIEEIAVRPVDGVSLDDQIRQRSFQEANRPFDLERGPMFRAVLLEIGPQDHVLLLTMHHIITDGWSFGVMVREFCKFYAAYIEGGEPDLPELRIQYADFAIWQRQWLQGGVLDEQLAYWKKHLAGARPLEMPANHPRSGAAGGRTGQEIFDLPTELTDGIKKLARSEGVTLFMLLLAAYQLMLARYTGKRDIVVGTDIANRKRLETEGLIGFFVNQLVLRTDLAGAPTFREMLKRVRETVLAAYDCQDVPFEKLVEELAPDRKSSATPLFQVKLVLQNMPRHVLTLPGLQVTSMDTGEASPKFDILLTLSETGQGLQGWNRYNASLFNAATIRSLHRFYHAVLAVVTEDCGMLDAPEARLLHAIEQRAHALMEQSGTGVPLSFSARRRPSPLDREP